MPVSDELLLKLIYQEEGQKALADASAQLETMTQAEKDLIKQNTEIADSSEKAAGGFSSMSASIVTLNQGLQLAEQGLALVKDGYDFAKEGATLERINTQWEKTAKDFGVNADQVIAAINKVTGNTLDQEVVIQEVSRTLTQGLVKDGDQITEMFKAAQAMAVRFGGSATDAFQAESMAIETGMSRQLRSQGIVVDFEAAYKKYADSVHKTVGELTDEEKQTIRLNEVLDKGAVLVAKVGDATGDSLSKFQRFEEGMKKIGDSLKEDFIGLIDPLLDRFDAISELDILISDTSTATDKLEAATKLNTNTQSTYVGKMDDEIARLKKIIELMPQVNALQMENVKLFLGIPTPPKNALTDFTRNAQTGQAFVPAAALETKSPAEIAKAAADQATAAKQYQSFQQKLSDIENKGYQDRVKIVQDATTQINKLESDTRDKRINILTSYTADEQKITDEQNKQRLDLARSFGTETERMELDHQREMQRMTEDHGKTMSKLADSRDALGIEDEIDRYNTEKQRAEEDYQTKAGQRNQDYAQQMADQNANFEAQRQARTEEKDKQLNELRISSDATRQSILSAEDQKARDLAIAQTNERTAAAAEWQLWREEHGIFLAGEKATYDAFLQYQLDALKVAMGEKPSSGAALSPAGTPFEKGSHGAFASGGYANPWGTYTVGENGPETLRMGARGGYVSPNAGNQISVVVNVGGTNASIAEIKSAVYEGITEVMQAASQ